MRQRVGLVGGVKSKLASSVPAQELYTSALFRGRRQWVEQTCDSWLILSAEHGVLDPSQVVEPYDTALADKSRPERRAWARSAIDQLRRRLGPLGEYDFELHAGANYVAYGLREALLAAGCRVAWPAEHLNQGRQRQLYSAGPPGEAGAPTMRPRQP